MTANYVPCSANYLATLKCLTNTENITLPADGYFKSHKIKAKWVYWQSLVHMTDIKLQ